MIGCYRRAPEIMTLVSYLRLNGVLGDQLINVNRFRLTY